MTINEIRAGEMLIGNIGELGGWNNGPWDYNIGVTSSQGTMIYNGHGLQSFAPVHWPVEKYIPINTPAPASGTYFELCFKGYASPSAAGNVVRVQAIGYLCSAVNSNDNIKDNGLSVTFAGQPGTNYVDFTVQPNGTFCGNWNFYPPEKWQTEICCDLQLAIGIQTSNDELMDRSSYTYSINQYNASYPIPCKVKKDGAGPEGPAKAIK